MGKESEGRRTTEVLIRSNQFLKSGVVRLKRATLIGLCKIRWVECPESPL